MTHPELTPGWEPANPEALRILLESGMLLLRDRGTYIVEPNARALGVHKGLPIIDHEPRFEMEVPFETVKELVPELTELVGLEGPLEIAYWEPVYTPDQNDELKLHYSGDQLTFYAPQSPQSPVKRRGFYITGLEDGRVVGNTGDDMNSDFNPLAEASFEEKLQALAEQYNLEKTTGANKITSAECSALELLVNHLILSPNR